jgi:sRNA-binding carbon storage regulator CsrA
MLVVSRKEHESICIEPAEGLDPSMTLREAFADGRIMVKLVHVGHRRVRLAIEAPPHLKVTRGAAPTVDAATPAADTLAAGPHARTAGA